VALILGFAIAVPILLAYYKPASSVQIEVDVVYAYFSEQHFNQNITGLWTNSSDSSQRYLQITSFFIVLNVTNLSDKMADLTFLDMMVGSNMHLFNITDPRTGKNSTAVESTDTIVHSNLAGIHTDWYQVWDPYQSRLIAFVGSVGEVDAITPLSSGFIYLYGSATGHPYDGGMDTTGYSFKHVSLRAFGTEFLYNSVLSDNQRWLLNPNGIDVSIVTIS
jgi:hypothetical protein